MSTSQSCILRHEVRQSAIRHSQKELHAGLAKVKGVNITQSLSVELKLWGSRVFRKLALLNVKLLAAVSAVIVAIYNWWVRLGHVERQR